MKISINQIAWREMVFMQEQNVPAELEWDGLDNDAQHWIAYADENAVGCLRVLIENDSAHIGRVAVLADYRNQGIGHKLMRAAIAQLSESGIRQIDLNAQIDAANFYHKLGFEKQGQQFLDAGITHINMQLYREEPNKPILGETHGRILVTNKHSTVLDFLSQTKRQLWLLSHSLEHAIFDHEDIHNALSTLARSSNRVDIRLLIVDSRPIVSRGHRLLELQRRLSSTIKIKKVSAKPEEIEHYFLVCDGIAALHLTKSDDEKSWADYRNKPLAEDYQTQFDNLWQHAINDPNLRTFS